MRHPQPSRVTLPPVPPALAHLPVAGWAEPIWIDSYLPHAPSLFPEFFDSRVYQASSGRVFPLPFHESISQVKKPHLWQALHVENAYVRLVILPELGGRIYVGYDKSAGYDFFYRNNVIKPALVGLAGPWVSGGVEFNWPQHHRPATFLPTDWEIETGLDGSVTAWCSDHDPFERMKGMHGIRIRPGSTLVEARVRLYNRTELTQTFLWWANAAAAAGDHYQAFFPTDVRYVADHGNRAMTTYPRAGRYYGVDYAGRVSTADPDADRLDWYRNIPVPTSYMILETEDDFLGGYDHDRRAGFVHVADRLVAPGKKLWTWGESAFGRAWNDNLTDDDPPYVELMAGVFTRNQPDFSFLAPGETKSFSQFWYPIRDIGPAQQANTEAAVAMRVTSTAVTVTAHIGVITTHVVDGLTVSLTDSAGHATTYAGGRIEPDAAMRIDVPLPSGTDPDSMTLMLTDGTGRPILVFGPHSPQPTGVPPPATVPAAPQDIAGTDELYFTGQYLRQYRHATRRPEPYWQETVARDPGDARSRLALAESAYRRHRLVEAHEHVLVALGRMLEHVPNPASGQAHYLLGLILTRLHRDAEAADALGKAAWSADTAAAANYARAKLAARHGHLDTALTALRATLEVDRGHLQAAALATRIEREIGDIDGANRTLAAAVHRDPLDQWLRHLSGASMSSDAPTLLDVALEYAEAGFGGDALDILRQAESAAPRAAQGQVNVGPLIHYHRARILDESGSAADCERELDRAAAGALRYCQASRLSDIDTLEWVVARRPDDVAAQLLLGNWHYAHGNVTDAVDCWRVAATAHHRETRATAHRNLGIAAYNVDHDKEAAADHFQQARAALPDDAKLLFECDQLDERRGVDGAIRLRRLEDHRAAVRQRDDLALALAELLTAAGQAGQSRDLLAARHFQPWEGGEGKALAAWEHAQLSLAHAALAADDAAAALRAATDAIDSPVNLGEARHPLANAADLYYTLGLAHAAAGDAAAANGAWSTAAGFEGDFTDMATRPFGTKTVWSIRALVRLGRRAEADALTRALRGYLVDLSNTAATIDFFATSLPQLLLFHDDPEDEKIALIDQIRGQLDELAGGAEPPWNRPRDQRGNHSQPTAVSSALTAAPAADPHR